MADLKISELGSIPAVASADVLAIVDTSLAETNKVSIEDLLRGAPSGTAASPSIAFVDDPDTGFHRSAANELSISTAGSQRVVVDAAGNVGIGTSSPGEKLEVSGTIKATDINFTGLSTYADDTAAGTGGLAAGDVYKTSTGELRIKL